MKRILLFACVIFLSLTTELFAQPINLTTTNILANSADLNWDASPCGGNVTLHYKVLGTNWPHYLILLCLMRVMLMYIQ